MDTATHTPEVELALSLGGERKLTGYTHPETFEYLDGVLLTDAQLEAFAREIWKKARKVYQQEAVEAATG